MAQKRVHLFLIQIFYRYISIVSILLIKKIAKVLSNVKVSELESKRLSLMWNPDPQLALYTDFCKKGLHLSSLSFQLSQLLSFSGSTQIHGMSSETPNARLLSHYSLHCTKLQVFSATLVSFSSLYQCTDWSLEWIWWPIFYSGLQENHDENPPCVERTVQEQTVLSMTVLGEAM